MVRDDGSGVGGVSVVLNELSFTDITEASGTFHFSSVPTGSYTITFTLGETARTLIGVTVTAGATTQIEEPANWTDGFAETLTVHAASRRIERIVEAPAAVTSVPEAEIEGSFHGQLPKLLESAPGVDFTQSGLYDFNFNTRGFNSSLNRRIADADRRPRSLGAVPRRDGVGGALLPGRRLSPRSSSCAARARRSTAPTPSTACST